MRPNGSAQITQRSLPLHWAGPRHSQQSGDRDFTVRAAASKTDFAPLHGAPQRAFGRVISRLHAVLIEKREEFFEMHQQRKARLRTSLSPLSA